MISKCFFSYGMKGLHEHAPATSYSRMMKVLQIIYPAIKDFIHSRPIDEGKGSGWSLEFHRNGETFGLTFRGIAKVCQQLGLSTKVTVTKEEIIQFLAAHKKGSIITHSGLLRGKKCDHHAVALLMERKDDHIYIFIGDNLAYYSHEDLCALAPKNVTIHLITTFIARQKEKEITCYAIAISDCLSFEKQPGLIDEILTMNHASKNFDQHLLTTKLPSSLMSLSEPLEARKRALEYQWMLIAPIKQAREKTILKTIFIVTVILLVIKFIYSLEKH